MMDLSDVDPLTCLDLSKQTIDQIRMFFGLDDDVHVTEFRSMYDSGHGPWRIIRTDEAEWSLYLNTNNTQGPRLWCELDGMESECVFRAHGYVLVLTSKSEGRSFVQKYPDERCPGFPEHETGLGELLVSISKSSVIGYIGRDGDEIR